MKVSKIKSPSASAKATADARSKVQSRSWKSRLFSNFGRRALDVGLQPSRLGDRNGIALVITLIMLAIITFMAVTFLVLSQRERSSVSTAMDQKIARDASDSAFSRVSAELLARMMLHTNFQDFDLMVSTNYYNAHGFRGGVPGSLSPTNVNYDYHTDGSAITDPQDAEINIASLLYNPRPPVYVITNAGTGQAEFRFYLDLNRNGHFDTNGIWPVISSDPALPHFGATNGLMVPANFAGPIASNYFVGDPEWIGVLARPWEMHSADNQFISRYAYLVIPAGKTLDVNTIHNQALTKTVDFPWVDGYMRNQGVGPWELNLAAFLTDLNTNIWPGPLGPLGYNPPAGTAYDYERPFNAANGGLSFLDAFSILRYRYNNTYASLTPAFRLFSGPAQLRSDNIDEYADGPIMTTTTNVTEAPTDPVAASWVGAENTNHYFSQQDLFNSAKVGTGFSARLQQAGSSNDSYNAYTFYRMLAQLGTDSQPDTTKLNINYKNTDINGNIVPGMETNHIPWTPEDFFTNAANRILATMTNEMGVALSTRYIPVYPTNYYTPAVHRALQLAANIFDATTNQTVPLVSGQTNAFFPSVFRPIFTVGANGQIYISDYRESTDAQQMFAFNYLDFNSASNQVGVHGNWIIYGVPWVVGAKKGFPNFNQFSFQTAYSLTRKLKLTRLTSTGAGQDSLGDYKGEQQFVMNIQNEVNMQAWNSYQSAWPVTSRRLRLYGTNIFTVRMMNDTNPPPLSFDRIQVKPIPLGADVHPTIWPGFRLNNSKNGALINLINSTNIILNGDEVSYDAVSGRFLNRSIYNPTEKPIPQFDIYTTNRVVFAMIDESTTPNRIVDFVNLDDSGRLLDYTGTLEGFAKAAPVNGQVLDPAVMWRTNGVNGPILPDAVSDGLNYQIEASIGQVSVTGWLDGRNPVIDQNNQKQIQGFENWLLNAPVGAFTNQTPYTPTYGITNQVSWEANDPLVHYTIPDLTDTQPLGPPGNWPPPAGPNHRYQPWDYDGSSDDGTLITSIAKKDPIAKAYRSINGRGISDAWDFPTNKFWNVGILGRVHRGTPWQTVYMKSPIVALKDWQNWSGSFINNTNAVNGRIFADASLNMPNADYQLFDLFTTSPNPSASRGQLDVNQTNLAAWSAVFSAVNVITNGNGSASTYIQPAGVYDPTNPSPVAKMWQGILNAKNNNTTNGLIFPNHTFQHVGDVLAAPELTVASPFVPPGKTQGAITTGGDEVYERIPQQIMSLLTLNNSPRFVIYSFGQTLHPAANHPLVTGGTFNGLCTNYQVTAESATRAVVRVEGTTDPKYVNGKVDSLGRSYPPHLVVEQFNVLSPD